LPQRGGCTEYYLLSLASNKAFGVVKEPREAWRAGFIVRVEITRKRKLAWLNLT